MAQNIQLLVGEKTYIHGSFSRPVEDSTVDRDSLLILMAHGFPGDKNGHEKLYLDLEFLLRDKGFHTLRFDFRGCGESEGREEEFTFSSACEDFKAVLRWAKEKNYTRFVYIGEGLGATVTLMNGNTDVTCYILLWPVMDPAQDIRLNFGVDTLDEGAKRNGYTVHYDHRIGLPFLKEMAKLNIALTLKDIKAPVLVMHGARDAVVPIEQLEILRTHIGSRRVEITSFHDGSHGLPSLTHRKTLYYHVKQFIEKYT